MDRIMDGFRNWWHTSNSKKSKGGLIFMSVCVAIFVGVLAWIFTQL